MSGPVFFFEGKQLFRKRNIVLFGAVFILLICISLEGINDYKTLLQSRQPFQKIEKDKVRLFLHYTFYGVRGVRLLFVPDPLCTIFNDLAVYSRLTANVDSAEGLYLYNSFKGKDLFAESGGYMDFSGFILLIGCFVGLLYGYDSTSNKEYLKLLIKISGKKCVPLYILLSRIVWLNLILWLLCTLSLFWLYFNGIHVVLAHYAFFVLLLSLVITFFILNGAVIGFLKKKTLGFIILAGVYFSFLFLIPWGVQKVVYLESKNIQELHHFEYDMLKVIMNLERKLYERFGIWPSSGVASGEIKNAINLAQEKEYKILRDFENLRLKEISQRVKTYQALTAFFPTTFYFSTSKELSSKGFENFLDFYEYAQKLKYEFISFYIERKFYNPLPASGVAPFIVGDENLYIADSKLPRNFLTGIIVTLGYLLIIGFLFSRYAKGFSMALQREGIGIESMDSEEVFSSLPGSEASVFVLCRNDEIKGAIVKFFESLGNAACIEKINTYPWFNGMRQSHVISYFCQLSHTQTGKVLTNLEIMGVNKDIVMGTHSSSELILKIYAAVKAAAVKEIFVIDDFLKQQSRQFEMSFFSLLTSMHSTGRKIIYLGSEMYHPAGGLDEYIHLERFAVFPLDISRVTLR